MTTPPIVDHCPICHIGDGEPFSAAHFTDEYGDVHLDPDVEKSWQDDHDSHHGDHGCPQCDREAGYPR